MIDRLADDHANARRLAEALASMQGVTRLDPATGSDQFRAVRSWRRVWPDDTDGRAAILRQRAAFLAGLAERGVRMIEYPKGMIRAIPHYGVEASDIDVAISAARVTLADIGLAPAVPV